MVFTIILIDNIMAFRIFLINNSFFYNHINAQYFGIFRILLIGNILVFRILLIDSILVFHNFTNR